MRHRSRRFCSGDCRPNEKACMKGGHYQSCKLEAPMKSKSLMASFLGTSDLSEGMLSDPTVGVIRVA
jgi:hypothetical protein